MATQHPLKAPRSFRDETDLERMRAILVEGRRSAYGAYYIHPGDLSWWLYYLPLHTDPWQNIFLWEAEGAPGALLGWTLLSPDWRAFDLFVHPDCLHTRLAEHMLAWSERRLEQIVRTRGDGEIRTMWIDEQDAWSGSILIRHGFTTNGATMLCLRRSLDWPVPEVALPAGFHVHSMRGEQDLEKRAAAQNAAFGSKIPFDDYCRRYERFMRSPVYNPRQDLVIEAPDGQIVAFCIFWLDHANQVGYFEPVGVHPDHQRQGFGKALLAEGQRRLQSAGMAAAQVCVEHDNLAGQGLYASAGFTRLHSLLTYIKPVNPEAG